MTIGAWGKTIVFSTSDSRILTFSKFTRNVGSEWATHNRIGKKDQSEFLRPSIQKVTFEICLDAALGVKPRAMLDAIANAIENGEVNTLVIGSSKVGTNKWKIKSCSETWETIYSQGELARAKANLTMEEYL